MYVIQTYTMEELFHDTFARIRLHMGAAAFTDDSKPKVRRVAAAYTVMRLSTDAAWKLFGELFINTIPTSAEGLNRTMQVVSLFLTQNLPVSVFGIICLLN